MAALPPCEDTMDLMIEAKDKEQAVFELYRKYSIFGNELFNDVLPYKRTDDNRACLFTEKKGYKKRKMTDKEKQIVEQVREDDVGMGGTERRVYWPQGLEEFLLPKKQTKKKSTTEEETDNQLKKKAGLKNDDPPHTLPLKKNKTNLKMKQLEKKTSEFPVLKKLKSKKKKKDTDVNTITDSVPLGRETKPKRSAAIITEGQYLEQGSSPESSDLSSPPSSPSSASSPDNGGGKRW